jgi:light-regulated signal transduction histidine kinase (bacteriophytochrome)
LQFVHEASKRMEGMVDGLLKLSQTGRRDLSKRVVELRPLVEGVLADLKPDLEGREIELEIGELPAAECDPDLIRQVFANLLSNAAKFTRPRERAIIRVGQMTLDGRPVIFVRDNGVGFDMKQAGKLFGVFQRLHGRDDFEGTGIGLATVQRIIQKHGGRVWAESQPDQGATFYFTVG